MDILVKVKTYQDQMTALESFRNGASTKLFKDIIDYLQKEAGAEISRELLNYIKNVNFKKEQETYYKKLRKWKEQEQAAFYEAEKTDPYINTQSMAHIKWHTEYKQAHPQPIKPTIKEEKEEGRINEHFSEN